MGPKARPVALEMKSDSKTAGPATASKLEGKKVSSRLKTFRTPKTTQGDGKDHDVEFVDEDIVGVSEKQVAKALATMELLREHETPLPIESAPSAVFESAHTEAIVAIATVTIPLDDPVYHRPVEFAYFFTGSGDRLIRTWCARKQTCVAKMRGHQDAVSVIKLCAERGLLISGTINQLLEL